MYLPLFFNLNPSVAAIVVAVVLSDADLLFAPHTCWSSTVFLCDSDVFARVAVVTTGRALLGVAISLTFPSSAFDCDSFFSLDFGRLRGLLVFVGGGEDAERDSVDSQ